MSVPDWLYTIDVVFAVFVFLFAAGGLRRGLSGELAHVVTLAGLLLALAFVYPDLTELASDLWSGLPPMAVQAAVVLVILLSGLLLFFVIRAILQAIFKARIGEASDKVWGSLIGMLRGVLIGLLVMVLLSLNGSAHQVLSQKSKIGMWVCSTLAPKLQPHIMNRPVVEEVELPAEVPWPVP